MGYIGAHGVQALHRYKYSGVDHSYVAKYVLQPFWSRCVNFFPLWMPPNMIKLTGYLFLVTSALLGYITLTGFLFLITSALLGYIYSPLLDTPPPRWVNFAHRFLLFLYQDVMRLHVHLKSWLLGALLCVDWMLSDSGLYQLFLSTSLLGKGSEWWAQPFGKSMPLVSWVPFLNEIPTNRAMLLLMVAFDVIPTVYCNINNVHKVVQATKGSMTRALAMLYSFVVLLGGVLLWDNLSPSHLMKNYPHLMVVGTGLAFGFLVGRMILAHLCDEPKGLKTNMCMSLLCLPFAVANALTARLNDGVPMVDDFWVLLAYTAYLALRIYCFRLRTSWGASIFLCALARAVGALGYVILSSFLIGENILALITINIHASLSYILTSLGGPIVPSMNFIYTLFGTLLLINCAFFVSLLHLLYAIFLTKFGMKANLRLPRWLAVAI